MYYVFEGKNYVKLEHESGSALLEETFETAYSSEQTYIREKYEYIKECLNLCGGDNFEVS